MTEFTPEVRHTNDIFTADDENEVERELDEQETHDVEQDAAILARQPADPDLDALAAMASDGFIRRSSGLWVAQAAILKTDLAAAVQTSLDLADASLQPHTGNARFQEWESTITAAVDTGWQPIPSGAYALRLNMIEPGIGGGSGRRAAAGTLRCGGGGGGGGGIVRSLLIPAAALGATEYRLIIPRPGTGGAAVAIDTNNGANGGLPSNGASPLGSYYTHFQLRDATTTVVYTLLIWPGQVSSGGGAGIAMPTSSGGYGVSNLGGNGATNLLTGVAAQAGNGIGAQGGSQGGGITTADVAANGGTGGWNPGVTLVTPTGGVVGGSLPTDGGDVKMNGRPGNGGAGGAASITGPAQAGRTPTGYGGGGGGGGASANGFASGAGGNGAPGYGSIEWVYA